MDWRERLRIESDSCLSELVADRPEFSLDAEQPSYRGGTHYVTFGRYQGKPAVFKYFVAVRRWRNEAACLARLWPTGLVPEVLHEQEGTLIVMERLEGADVLSSQALGPLDAEGRRALSREVGAAFGRLATASAPGPAKGYDPRADFPDWGWSDGLPSVVERCLRLGRTIADSTDPTSAETLRASLNLIEERVSEVTREPWGLFHEDASNVRVEGTRFVRFYDLELCRGGTPSMQLGAALSLASPERLSWRGIVQGFEWATATRLTDADLRSVLAMSHLSLWIRACDHLLRNDGVVDASMRIEAEEGAERMRAAGRAITE